MAHAIIALLIQLGFGVLTGNWWIGGVLGAALFMGREHAQAEYRWIAAYTPDGRRASMPWWGGFDPKVWHKWDAVLDMMLPLLAVVTLGLINT